MHHRPCPTTRDPDHRREPDPISAEAVVRQLHDVYAAIHDRSVRADIPGWTEAELRQIAEAAESVVALIDLLGGEQESVETEPLRAVPQAVLDGRWETIREDEASWARW